MPPTWFSGVFAQLVRKLPNSFTTAAARFAAGSAPAHDKWRELLRQRDHGNSRARTSCWPRPRATTRQGGVVGHRQSGITGHRACQDERHSPGVVANGNGLALRSGWPRCFGQSTRESTALGDGGQRIHALPGRATATLAAGGDDKKSSFGKTNPPRALEPLLMERLIGGLSWSRQAAGRCRHGGRLPLEA